MEKKILKLVDSYWKFDSDQSPVSSYHDKQDLLKAIEKEFEYQLADIRNRMSPVKNLLALIKHKRVDDSNSYNYALDELIKKRICKNRRSY